MRLILSEVITVTQVIPSAHDLLGSGGRGRESLLELEGLLFILGKSPRLWLFQMPSRLATESGTELGTRQPPLPGVTWGPCVKSSWPDTTQRAAAIKVDLSVSQEGYLLELFLKQFDA